MSRSDPSTPDPSTPDPSTTGQTGFPWRRLIIGAAIAVLLFGLGGTSIFMCLPAWLRFGIVVDRCPVGRPIATTWLRADDLRRGQWRRVVVGTTAHYTTAVADDDRTTELRRPAASLDLVSPDGSVTTLKPRKGWTHQAGGGVVGDVMLPAEFPDGDYLLRAATDSRLGRDSTDIPLALYAPARIHVLTDRPLYEPGNTIQVRALMLRASDLLPLAQRPGTWVVTDSEGTVLLEERAVADSWGIVAGSFPLDSQAAHGDWQISWQSGADTGSDTVRVEPFTLPRFSVEAKSDRRWLGPGDQPTVRGSVRYASGAAVAHADVRITWRITGDWPAPTAWFNDQTKGSTQQLPTAATTDEGGRFTLSLPVVPTDLTDQARLIATIDATDPAGDHQQGSVSILLSADPIAVQAVTELGQGLVEGFNNRVYLRATTPDGQPLRQVDLTVRRAWDPGDRGQVATTDSDGVAALQLDPGPAVNVVVPAMPVRLPPRRQALHTPSLTDLIDGGTVALADQRAVDEWTASMQPCARFAAAGPQAADLVLDVRADGSLQPVSSTDSSANSSNRAMNALTDCLAHDLAGRRLPAGRPRLLRARWTAQDPDLPHLALSSRGWPSVPGELQQQLDLSALDARRCLPEDATAGAFPYRLQWRSRAGRSDIQISWLPVSRGARSSVAQSPRSTSCVEGVLGQGLRLTKAASQDAVGIVDATVQPSRRRRVPTAQPTTMLGYELEITAKVDERRGAEALGRTTLRLPPGQVPSARLRATPVLPARGQTVVVEFLRGPDFSADLPKKLVMTHQGGKTLVTDLDPDTRTASFDLPDDLEGWFSIAWGDVTARVFVRPQGQLRVSVTPDRQLYAPGDTATLTVSTTQDGQGGPAAVTLVGVDETLGQLVTLPDADELESLQDTVRTDAPAFGSLDGQALSLGRIQGDNAATATVLRVSEIPGPQDRDRDVQVAGGTAFDPVLPLADHFYTALSELHVQVRAWERQAPADAQLDNAQLASLWAQARDACDARGQPITDAYGRPLRLAWLPQDLLALTAPRAVVSDATRLPEDVVAWSRWVAEEEPR